MPFSFKFLGKGNLALNTLLIYLKNLFFKAFKHSRELKIRILQLNLLSSILWINIQFYHIYPNSHRNLNFHKNHFFYILLL